MFEKLLDDHISNDSSIEETRLKLYAQSVGVDCLLVEKLLVQYNVEQVEELIVIPDFFERIEEFVNPNLSAQAIGLIRDLVYTDYYPGDFNISELSNTEIKLLRSKLKVKNIREILSENREEVNDDFIGVDIEETTEEDVDFENFDNFFDFLDGGNLQNDLNDYFDVESQEEEMSEEEFYLNYSDLTYLDFLYNRVLSKAILLNPKDEKAIFDMTHEKEYYDRFFHGNMRLAVRTAFRFSFSFNYMQKDLIQAGFLGVLKAMERFDSNLGFKFSTYAMNHIKQQISRYIQDFQSVVRIPVHKRESLSKLSRLISSYTVDNFVKPDIEYISNELGLSQEEILNDIELIEQCVDFSDLSLSRLCKLYSSHFSNPTTEYIDYITKKEIVESVIFNTLNEREIFVLSHRYGLNSEFREHTLEEIGNMLGVTRERIRQIESKSLRRLKKNRELNELFDIMKL